MAIRFGPVEPMQLIFNIINILVTKNLISLEEADLVIKESLDPSLSEEEKEKIINAFKGINEEDKNNDTKKI